MKLNLNLILFLLIFIPGLNTSDQNLIVHIVPFSSVDVSNILAKDDKSKTEIDIFRLLTHVLDELDESLSRKFVWPELFYFKKWYFSSSHEIKSRVHRAVRDGQFEFINGLSSQIDEGTWASQNLFNDLSDGLDFLKNHFNIGISTFFAPYSTSGHSNSTIKVLKTLGFNSIVISNIHYLVKNQFKSNQHLEFNWGSDKASLLTHVLSDENLILEEYDFESDSVRQVADVRGRGDKLVKYAREISAFYRTNHILIPFGGKFKFSDPLKQYANLEKIFEHINKKVSNIEVKFATFGSYFAELDKHLVLTNNKLPLYSGDFFPNSRGSDDYFVKRLIGNNFILQDIHRLDSLINSVEVFYILARLNYQSKNRGDKIERIVGVKENNEVVSNVDESNDPKMWHQYLYHTIHKAKELQTLLTDGSISTNEVTELSVKTIEPMVEEASENMKDTLLECIENILSKKVSSFLILKPELSFKVFEFNNFYSAQHPIILYNEAFDTKVEVISFEIPLIPIARIKELQLYDNEGEEVECQIFKRLDENNKVSLVLSFLATIPPLSATTYFITGVSPRGKLFIDSKTSTKYVSSTIYSIRGGELIVANPNLRSQKELELEAMNANSEPKDWADNEGIEYSRVNRKVLFIENENVKLELSTQSGMINSIEDKHTGRITRLNQAFFEYISNSEDVNIFSPKARKRPVSFGDEFEIRETRGNQLHEIEIHSNTFSQHLKLSLVGDNVNSVEVIIRPKFIAENRVFTMRLSTNMGSKGTFYTAASDKSYIKRKSYQNVPLASNFYPAFGSFYLEDSIKFGQQLTLSFDGVLAVSSLLDEEDNSFGSNMDILLHTTESFKSRSNREKLEFKFRLSLGKIQSNQRVTHTFWPAIKPAFALETKQTVDLLQMSVWTKYFKVHEAFATHLPGALVTFRVKNQFDDEYFLEVKNSKSSSLNFDVENIFDKKIRVKHLAAFSMSNEEPFNLGPFETVIYTGSFGMRSSNDQEIKSLSNPIVPVEKEILKNAEMEQQYKDAIQEDKEMLKVLEKRIKRTKNNLVELETELKYIPKTSFQAHEETQAQIKLTEKSLNELTDKLVLRMQHMKETEQKLDVLIFRKQAIDIQNGGSIVLANMQMREWEATLHGIITGAGGMLVLVLLYNLLCVRLDKLPRVPIKWVGFKDEEALPLLKEN